MQIPQPWFYLRMFYRKSVEVTNENPTLEISLHKTGTGFSQGHDRGVVLLPGYSFKRQKGTLMNKGILYTVVAYIIWGLIPIYFKWLHTVDALQIVSHRMLWSFVFLWVLLALRREVRTFFSSLDRRFLLIYLVAGILLALNWLVYVWAVNAGFVVEGSLGYFINPLISVLLGVIFLKEKLRPLQWLPVGLAAAGVLYLTISLRTAPWISLALALTFGLYGLLKKIAPLNALNGLTLETTLVLLPAVGYLLFVEFSGSGAFIHAGFSTSLLLVFCGVVTATPLLLFAAAAQQVPLSTLGLLQYISPTLQFLVGVFLYHESFTQERAIGFSIIWLALILFSMEGFFQRRKELASSVA